MSEEITEIEEVDTEEQKRIEHENMLKSFPATTIFYQDLCVSEDASVKFLQGVTDVPLLAEQLGILDQHYDLSELTLKKGVFYLKGYEKTDPTLAELKARKLAEIKAVADQYAKYECETMYLTSSVGFKINADHKSQDNIRGLIALNTATAFKDFDNQFHQVSVDDLNTMLTECYVNGSSLYQQKFEYESRVDAAKSAEDLYFDVTFSMADFSAK